MTSVDNDNITKLEVLYNLFLKTKSGKDTSKEAVANLQIDTTIGFDNITNTAKLVLMYNHLMNINLKGGNLQEIIERFLLISNIVAYLKTTIYLSEKKWTLMKDITDKYSNVVGILLSNENVERTLIENIEHCFKVIDKDHYFDAIQTYLMDYIHENTPYSLKKQIEWNIKDIVQTFEFTGVVELTKQQMDELINLSNKTENAYIIDLIQGVKKGVYNPHVKKTQDAFESIKTEILQLTENARVGQDKIDNWIQTTKTIKDLELSLDATEEEKQSMLEKIEKIQSSEKITTMEQQKWKVLFDFIQTLPGNDKQPIQYDPAQYRENIKEIFSSIIKSGSNETENRSSYSLPVTQQQTTENEKQKPTKEQKEIVSLKIPKKKVLKINEIPKKLPQSR